MSKRSLIPYRGSMLNDLVLRLKLILRLMADRRVNPFLKLLPLASLVYLIWPADAIPLPIIGVVDDAAVLWLGAYLFIEFCPTEVVQEHLARLTSNLELIEKEQIIDGEVREEK